MSNAVEHPSHYNKKGRKECIVEMEEYDPVVAIMYCLTSAQKYLYRKGEKDNNPIEQELNKARWCFDYTNKLIDKYGTITFNGTRIEETKLYLDIKEMLENE